MKSLIEEKLKRNQLKLITNIIFFLLYSISLNSFEIIRDPIFESYIEDYNVENLKIGNIFLVKSDVPNAFVINKSIYFTTGLIKEIKDEGALISIFYHELGHVENEHYTSKKIGIERSYNNKVINNIFSVGIAIITGNPNLGIASNLAIDQSLMGNLSRDSIKLEVQADDYMIKMIEKNHINTKGLINFFEKLPDEKNYYFQTHPRKTDRIRLLKQYSNNKTEINSILFEWIKAKYSQQSSINKYNLFFENLEKGIINDHDQFIEINQVYIDYELYKKGLNVNNLEYLFLGLIEETSNTYLKIEFYNYIIDNNLEGYYQLIEKEKHNQKFQNEYFYYFLIGKYYNKINNIQLSNYYFCQFYKLVKIDNKSNYYCDEYDIKNISRIDRSYGIFK